MKQQECTEMENKTAVLEEILFLLGLQLWLSRALRVEFWRYFTVLTSSDTL